MTTTNPLPRRIRNRRRTADSEAMVRALELADGDARLLEVSEDGLTVVVRNRPAT